MSDRIDILLAVFNGEPYLREQLDSLLGQDCPDWFLHVRDDGSRDGSRELLSGYQRAHPGRISVILNDGGDAGTLQNFSALLELSTARYIMFCDQDDVWLPGKISATMRKMREMERAHGRDLPLLVHTDLKVTDASLRVVAESLWRYQKSDPVRGASLNRLLIQNCATGCSVMINRPLRDLALPIPQDAMMHDWWLSLVAAAFGAVGHVAEPTMLYRQHGRNDTGAKRWSAPVLALRLARPAGIREFLAERNRVLAGVRNQARAFAARYAAWLTGEQREMLAAFVSLGEVPFLLRKWRLVRFGFFHAGLARNLAWFLLA